MKLRSALLLLGAFVLAGSCQKEENLSPGHIYHFSVEAGAPLTKALILQGNELKASWSTSESVTVLQDGAPVGTLHPARDGASTTLTGSLTGDFAAGDRLTLWFPGNEVDYSGQKGTLEDIASKYDFASATVRITEVSGDRITAVDSQTGGAARFGNEQAIVRFVLKDKDGDGVCALALTVLVEGMNALVIKPETTASELFVALPGFSGKSVTLSATIDRGQTEVRLYRLRKESISLENGKYYVISARMKEFSEDAVDLGLPSGTLWARRNIGASSSQDAGSYFAWGETAGHGSDRTFDWENYTHSGSAVNTLTKYNNNSYYGPVVDNKTVLEEGDDAGYVLWDSFWGLPSTVQVNELVEQTDREWTSVEGLPGWRFTSKTNGNSIFIPATGYYDGNVLSESDKGYYWLNEINTGNPNQARNLVFGQYSNQSVTSLADGFWWNSNPRYRGLSVRPVVRQ